MTAAEYSRLVKQARAMQLAADRDVINGVDSLLQRVAKTLAQEVLTIFQGTLSERYKRALLVSVGKAADTFRAEYKSLLDASISRAADASARAEITLERALLDSKKAGLSATVVFGSVARRVIEKAYQRTFRDGLTLSQRLYNMDAATRRSLTETVIESIAKGESSRRIANRLREVLTASATDTAAIAEREKQRKEALKTARVARATGAKPKPVANVENIRFRAMRIARTETNLAYREGQIASITEDDGSLKHYVRAIGWRLSPSHPRPDICDVWASEDSGLGHGNYLPGDVPPGHPCCLCHTVTLLHAIPDMEFVQLPPRPDKVPPGQLEYYGVKS